MIFFGRPKFGCGANLGGNWLLVFTGFVQVVYVLLRRLFLPVIQVKNCRTIIAANIRALAVNLRWVLNAKKDIQQLPVCNLGGVVRNLHGFGMACCMVANLFVCWILGMTSSIANLRFNYARRPVKNLLNAPKASGRK